MDFARTASRISCSAKHINHQGASESSAWYSLASIPGALVGIVPIGLFAAALLYFHWQAQEHERQRSQMETVRLLAAAVDNSLDSTVERLSIFARLWSSSSLSEQMVHAQAKEALGANADWSSIVAFDTNGRGVFRTDAPFGPPVQANARIDVWQPVFTERRPVISDVLLDATNGAQHVAVGVPVLREGRVAYVLIAQLKLGWYDRLMTQQGQPDGAVAGLVDRNFKFVARSSEGEERRGADPTLQWVADLSLRPEGIARYTNLNGTAVYTAWTFTRHGWAVGFGTPSAPVDNAFWDHLLVLGLVWAAAVAIGMVHAFSKARVIAASLESLEAQAEHVATGRRIEGLPDSHVAEVNAGKIVYIAGQVALDRAGNLVGKDDFRAQVQQVFENLKSAVEAAGGDFNSVVKLNYFCAESVDPSQITVVREIRDKYVNTSNPPVSTFVVVKRLVRPELLIEVEAVAVVKK